MSPTMATPENVILKVVGGKDKGGILVREEKATSSPALLERLSTGALVRVRASVGCRVLYELVKGTGPHSGWVSTQAGSTTLMVPADKSDSDDDSAHEVTMVSDSEASTQDTPRTNVELTDERVISANMAMQEYMQHFGKDFVNYEDCNRARMPKSGKVQTEGNDSKAHRQVREQLARELSMSRCGKERAVGMKASKYLSRPAFALLADSDGNNATLCRQCHLPVGDVAYNGPNRVGIYHGECMAQHLLHEMRDDELVRKQKVLDEKKARHEEYAIGWTPEAVPTNAGPAEKLACRVVPEGMCCLVLQENSETDCSVRVAATVEPAASVNLEYLSLALEVRRREGREPLFSLDPVDPTDRKTMQGKRFEPEWLAGTSLGEVMFQADYQLKELSMGSYEQPVMGMKSCFDYAEAEDTNNAWDAREWFMVKDADVHVSANNVLLPYIRMGVEAREQVVTEKGMQDTAMTRKDHPLVKYAEAFTQNFDLIAERRSAVFHLREAAKASILSKFLLESNVNLEQSWFNLATMQDQICPMEVPQLWNERVYSQIHVKDGTIVDADKGIGSSMRGIYGGVELGLDKFVLAATPAPKRKAPLGPRLAGLSQPPRAGTAAPVSRGVTPLVGLRTAYTAMSTLMSMAPPPEPGVEVPAMAVKKPEGVDLNLDAFNLSHATRVQLEVPEASQSLDSCITVGSTFWANLDKQKGGFESDDSALLRAIFNPKLSDRRDEGDRFVPPDPSPQYVDKLRKLVKSEELLSSKRKAHFCSNAFARNDPGEFFPASWTSTFEMAHGELQTKSLEGHQQSSLLQCRPDYKAEAHIFEECIKSTVPAFDKSVEDGTRFRIYQVGTIEVRTMQDLDASEELVAVFSVRSPTHTTVTDKKDWLVGDMEHFAKVTEYVERDAGEASRAGKIKRRYFIVLETQRGNMISTEMLEDGRMKWEENPDDLEDRISLAKVLRTTNCQEKSNTVRNLKLYLTREAEGAVASVDKSKCKRYAQLAFFHAQGFRDADVSQVATISAVEAVNVPHAVEVKHEEKPVRRKNKLDISSLGLMSTNLMMPSNR
mmetsp:Transcript_134139/g.244693  ORF Transcript_134139/g.244693 Transcript_134139/m.244693 type:complete len:1058 (-) Transcript_134139:187-3360(-)